MEEIVLKTSDIQRIAAVLERFNAPTATITKDSSSGIGYTVNVSFQYFVEGCECTLTVPVVDVDDW